MSRGKERKHLRLRLLKSAPAASAFESGTRGSSAFGVPIGGAVAVALELSLRMLLLLIRMLLLLMLLKFLLLLLWSTLVLLF